MQKTLTCNMEILVCGAGSIGKRHIENLQKIGVTVSAWRSRRNLVDELSDTYGIEVYTSIDAAIKSADGVIVATTTDTHIEIATKVIKQNKPLFIEKPLSDSYESALSLLKNVTDQHIVEVGFQLRAHPALISLYKLIENNEFGNLYTYRAVIGQRLDEWRPGTDYRESYSANQNQGGGALLDLTHEIDLIQWLTGPINRVYGDLSHVSDLQMNAEDLVNLILVNKNGAVGQIQLDMLSPVYRRELELVFKDAVLYWNAITGVLEQRTPEGITIRGRVKEGFERNDMFLCQMQHFISRINDNSIRPLCSIKSGIEVQRIVEAVKKSSVNKESVKVGSV